MRSAALAVTAACALALAACGGSSGPPLTSRQQLESCVRKQGLPIVPFAIPALSSEDRLVRSQGGSDFQSRLKLASSSGAIAFFVYRGPAQAQAAAARVLRLVQLNAALGQKGTVFVKGNVVGATFLRLPPATEGGFRACTS